MEDGEKGKYAPLSFFRSDTGLPAIAPNSFSQAVLITLSDPFPCPSSKSFTDTQFVFIQLQGSLQWLLGHFFLPGSDLEDILAKVDATHNFNYITLSFSSYILFTLSSSGGRSLKSDFLQHQISTVFSEELILRCLECCALSRLR